MVKELDGFMSNLTSVTTPLQIAFDSTLLALFLSAALMLVQTLVYRRSEDLLARIDRWIVEHVLPRFGADEASGAGRQRRGQRAARTAPPRLDRRSGKVRDERRQAPRRNGRAPSRRGSDRPDRLRAGSHRRGRRGARGAARRRSRASRRCSDGAQRADRTPGRHQARHRPQRHRRRVARPTRSPRRTNARIAFHRNSLRAR